MSYIDTDYDILTTSNKKFMKTSVLCNIDSEKNCAENIIQMSKSIVSKVFVDKQISTKLRCESGTTL